MLKLKKGEKMYKQIRESKYEINDKGEIRNRETKQILRQQNLVYERRKYKTRTDK